MARTDRSLRRGGGQCWKQEWAEPTAYHRGTPKWKWMYIASEALESPNKGYCACHSPEGKRYAKRRWGKAMRRLGKDDVKECNDQ